MIEIKRLTPQEIENFLPLVLDVFCRCEASSYPEEGKQAFWNAIHDPAYLQTLEGLGAYDGDRRVGILATREKNRHIALFFVDGNDQGKGIGRMLFETCIQNPNLTSLTVHSSVYAVKIYEKLGFTATDSCREEGGIRYVPMIWERFQQKEGLMQ